MLHLGIATRYQEHITSHCACGAGTSRPPTTPFPRLDGVPVAACLGARHGSIPRPPCPLRGRGKGEIRFRRQHMPPETRGWTPRSATLSPLPRPLVRGAGLSPPCCGSGSAALTVGLSVRAGARSPLGTRLGHGSPNLDWASWATRCAQGLRAGTHLPRCHSAAVPHCLRQ